MKKVLLQLFPFLVAKKPAFAFVGITKKISFCLLLLFIVPITLLQAQVASVSIALTSGMTYSCPADPLTYTATAINGGSAPTFQWKVNGANVGSNSNTFTTSTLTDGQIISCVMTSHLAGVTGSPSTSNSIGQHIVTASNALTIDGFGNAYNGSLQSFSTSSPGIVINKFQWKVDGIDDGLSTNVFYKSFTTPGHTVSCEISTNTCNLQTVTSNVIPIQVTNWKPAGFMGSSLSQGYANLCYSKARNTIYAASNSTVFFPYLGNYSILGNSWANGSIFTICADPSGHLYAGGTFTNSSGNKYVAKWDSTSWVELGGLNALHANANIISMCADALGNIYAAGSFQNSGSNCYVAKWNGSAWSELVGLITTLNAQINSICADAAGNIYAGGTFNNANGNYYVAKWNGSTWSELGGLNGLSANGAIFSVCSDSLGNIYTAGAFKNAQANNYVALYNGAAWTELGGANSLVANNIIKTIVATNPSNVVAAGIFTNGNGKQYVAKWDGNNWSDLGTPYGLSANAPIYSLCKNQEGDIFAAGTFTNRDNSLLGNKYIAEYSVSPTQAKVNISVTSGSNPNCFADFQTFTASPTNGGTSPSYVWRVSGSITSYTGSTFSTNAIAEGKYVTCEMTSNLPGATGNPATSNPIILYNYHPKITASATTLCSGSTSTLSVTRDFGVSYKWRLNGVDIPGATGSSYVAATSGLYKCYVTYALCNVNSNEINITINSSPIASITSQTTSLCSGGNVTLSANSGIGLSYQWNLNSVAISGATAATYAATGLGSYTCTVSNSCGSSISNAIVISSIASIPPAGSINGLTSFCAWLPMQFGVAPIAGATTYNWSVPTGAAISSGQGTNQITIAFPNTVSSGTISVYGSNGTCSGTPSSLSITIMPSPDIPTTTNAVGCAGSAIALTGFPSGGTWSVPNPYTGPTTTFYYTVSNANTCSASSMLNTGLPNTITVNPLPAVSAANVSGCAGAAIALSGFPSGGTFSLANPYIGSVSTSYTYTYTNGNGCTNTSVPSSITINQIPIASIIALTTTICAGTNTTLSANTGTGLSYQWNLNNAPIAGANAATYAASAAGTYSCTLSNACGSATSNLISILVNPLPTASISASATSICAGSSTTLSANTGSGLSYQWKLNNTAISGATAATYATTAAGSYTCVVTNSCGSLTSNVLAIIVNPLPIATITSTSTSICTGGSILFSANTGSGLSYQWKLNNTAISGATAATYSATATGSYSCTVSNSCGSLTSNVISVTINPLPVASITSSATSVCSGGSILLSANTGTGLSYQWKLNTAAISGATSATYSAIASGAYSCTVTNTCGSAASNTITISTGALPSATITAAGATNFCSGGSVTLNAPAVSGYTYQWKINGLSVAGATSASYIATTAGNHKCTISNACGSVTSNIISITINAPVANITASGATTFCGGGSVVLSAPVQSGVSYVWKKDGTTITGATASSYSANSNGNYKCVASSSCGSATSNIITVIAGLPAKSTKITGAAAVCPSAVQSYSAAVVPTATSYSWTVPSGANISAGQGTSAITVQYGATITAGSVSCKAINTCGVGTAKTLAISLSTTCISARLTENEHITGEQSNILVFPNPSEAGIFNITFENIPKVDLSVYDLLGKNVFEAEQIDASSNYSLNLAALPKGVYVLKLQGSEINKIIRIQK